MIVQSMIDSKNGNTVGVARRRSRRGVSLIEILIVLVILVVGILTIIRLFPSGFFSVESVGNAALADSLGIGTVQGQTQNSGGLPDAILPGTMDADGQPTVGPLIPANTGKYDPDRAENLDNAHVIYNETMTVPSARTVAGVTQSVYVVSFGPLQMGNIDPAGNLTQLPMYVSINSLPWFIQAYTVAGYPNPKDLLALGQPNYLVDYSTGQIALPYAFYAQNFVMMVRGSDDVVTTLHLTVPAAYAVDPTNLTDPNGPLTFNKDAYRDSTPTAYNGRWFNPADASLAYEKDNPFKTPLAPWKAVMLLRPFQGVKNTTGGGVFSADPYEFKLPNANIVDLPAMTSQGNIGAIWFNPLGAGRIGVKPLKAQITYQNYSWRILHEDRDISALTPGNTTVARLTLKNLRRVGDARPDNTIDSGLIPGSNVGFVIQDLDTGLPLAGPINDEDTNGTVANQINLSYATGRITFPDTAFAPAGLSHHVRIYYAGDAQWTVAVQKSSAHYTDVSATASASGILPGQFAFDGPTLTAYFPQSEAGRTIAFEGTYLDGSTQRTFALTGVVGPALYAFAGGNYVRVTLTDTSAATPILMGSPTAVTFSAVRGLSARAVVAWKERDRWKVHTVDTVLTKSQ